MRRFITPSKKPYDTRFQPVVKHEMGGRWVKARPAGNAEEIEAVWRKVW